MEAEELLPDLSESSVALIPDLDKGNARKLQTKITHEHKEFLNKTLANPPSGFIPSMQGWFNIQKSINVIHQINRLKKEDHILVEAKKAFDRI